MCRAVAEALATGTHLVVQAGTGTGKSLAYLVPAALSGKKVVVATATKALQDQLAEKDLPLVEAGLGPAGAAGLRRPQGAEQLRLPPAGGRGGLGWDPGRARRPGAGRADEPEQVERVPTRPRAAGATAGGDAPPEGIVEEVRQPGGLVADVADRRPGRPELRAVRPGLEHGQRRPAGVPGRLQLPLGRALLRRGRPRPGRRWPTSWWSTPTSTGRTWPAAGWCCPSTTWSIFDEAHELEEVMTSSLGVEVTPGRFRSLVDLGPLAGRRTRRATCSTPWPRSATSSARCFGDRVGTRVLHDEARPPVDDRELAELLARAAEVSRRVTDALRRGGAQRSLPRRGRRVRPTPTAPAARRAPCRPPCTWRRTCTGSSRAATARWPGSTARGATSGSASPPSTSGPCSRRCSGAR